MKKPCIILGVFCWLGLGGSGATAADISPSPRITVYLRDGSRVVAESLGDEFHFHSPVLGELTLAAKDIRSVECLSSNAVKLQMADGDTLNASFTSTSLAAKTGYGQVEFPVSLIRKITVAPTFSSSRAHLPGLVSLWPGEGNANDSAGPNHGKPEGQVNFTTGQIGRAFYFTTAGDHVRIPASPTLDVAGAGSFSITAWINPAEVTGAHSLLEWNTGDGNTYWGVHFCLDANSFNSGPGTLYANLVDQTGAWHQIHSPPGVVTPDFFQFVAVTYDQTNGMARLYCNGVIVAQSNLGSFTPNTRYDLFLGHRPLTQGETSTYLGALDEVAVYNRALSDKDIEEQCRDDNGGELPPAPAIPGGVLTPTTYPIRPPSGFGPMRLSGGMEDKN